MICLQYIVRRYIFNNVNKVMGPRFMFTGGKIEEASCSDIDSIHSPGDNLVKPLVATLCVVTIISISGVLFYNFHKRRRKNKLMGYVR